MKLLLSIEVECDECYSDEPEELKWLIDDILMSPKSQRLILHSNEIGDEIGTVKVLSAKLSTP